MRHSEGIGEGINILFGASVDAGKVLFDEDGQYSADAKIDDAVYADLFTIRPGPSHFNGHDYVNLASRCLGIDSSPVAIASEAKS